MVEYIVLFYGAEGAQSYVQSDVSGIYPFFFKAVKYPLGKMKPRSGGGGGAFFAAVKLLPLALF